jgi:hypothetical protein
MRRLLLAIGAAVMVSACSRADAIAPAAGEVPAREAATASPAPAKPAARTVEYREVTLPVGTVLPVELRTAVGSDTSEVEDAVAGRLRRGVSVEGVDMLPAGTMLYGSVTSAKRAGRVKGRASVAYRFTQLDAPGPGGRVPLKTATLSHEAEATKGEDATKIGVGAAGGAIVGGILGGGSGAAKGAAAGGGAGTALVLATRGHEVQVNAGAPLAVRLTAPLTLQVRR